MKKKYCRVLGFLSILCLLLVSLNGCTVERAEEIQPSVTESVERSVTETQTDTFDPIEVLEEIIEDPIDEAIVEATNSSDDLYVQNTDAVDEIHEVTRSSYKGEGGTYWYTGYSDGTATITSFLQDKKVDGVVIPEIIDGYTVTVIDKEAFYDRIDERASVVIPDSVVEIGIDAFKSNKISYVYIGAGVQSIGKRLDGDDNVFGGSGVSSFSVSPLNETYTTIDGNLFNKKEKELLAYVGGGKVNGTYTIPNGITRIGNSAFCDSIPSTLIMPDTITAIGDNAFNTISHTTMTIRFSEALETIGSGAFEGVAVNTYGYDNSKEVMAKRHGYQNSNYYGLAYLVLPASVREIGNFAFSFCAKPGYVLVDLCNTQINEIPSYAFSHSVALEVKLPDTLLKIDDGAFSDCCFNQITIPKSVTKIGFHAFNKADGKVIFDEGSQLKEIETEAFADMYDFEKELVLPNGLEIIGGKALMSGFTSIKIPASVKQIGDDFCKRDSVLYVEPGSYAAEFALKHGYRTETTEDISWLQN